MRALIVIGLVAAAGCTQSTATDAPPRRLEPSKPSLSGIVELPGEDGRVYVIDVPATLSLERASCLLHVTRQGTSAIACTPPRIELSAPEPMER